MSTTCRRCHNDITARTVGDNLIWQHTDSGLARCPDDEGWATPEEPQFPDQDGHGG